MDPRLIDYYNNELAHVREMGAEFAREFPKVAARLGMEGVELEVRPSALKAIARKALARKTGARGLRSILEQSLIDTMFELPNVGNVDKVVVDEATIDENKPPLLVYREAAKKA